jgi:hypothetical protein
MQLRKIALGFVLLPSLATILPQSSSGESANSTQSKDLDGKPTLCREGCAFSDLNAAIKAASPGSVIRVAPGIYGICGIVDKPLRLIGLKDASGKRAHLAGGVCNGKGPLVLKAPDIVIQGFEISNVTVPSKNGACIRIDPEAGDVIIRDIYCHDSEDGILGGPKRGNVTIEDSRFERNGSDQGQAHSIYVYDGDNLVIRRTQIFNTKGEGHTVKSGAKRTVIEDSILAALDSQNSRAIDFFAGGVLEVRRSVIEQGKNSDNSDAFGIALESSRINPEPHSTLIENNWIIFDDLERGNRLLRVKQFGPITVRGNNIVGMTSIADSYIEAVVENNRLYRDRNEAGLPKYDGSPSSLPKPGS